MAASLASKLIIVLIFLNLLTQVTFVKRVVYMHKNIVFKDPVGLIVDGLVSKRYGLIFPINYHHIILRRSNYKSNFGVSLTVSKSTKHGYTTFNFFNFSTFLVINYKLYTFTACPANNYRVNRGWASRSYFKYKIY